MKIREVFDGLFLVTTETQRELGETFLRFQEHYESPHRQFTTGGFSRERFKRWYRRQPGRGGRFTYFSDWAGFNVPGTVFKSFQDGTFKNLTVREKRILKKLQGRNPYDFYVIGTSSDNGHEALKHEIAHGLFFLDSSYRYRVETLIQENARHLKRLKRHLLWLGYAPTVFVDELHAYVLCEKEDLVVEGIWTSALEALSKQLDETFVIHYPNLHVAGISKPMKR